jgi:hypothetical protein
MIEVAFSPQAAELLSTVGLSADDVITTVNDRHRGVLDPGVSRLIAVHWFSPSRLVYVDAVVTQKAPGPGRGATIRQVRVALALPLTPDLPTDRVSPEMNLETIAVAAAKSFGLQVTCHPQQ